MKRYETRLRALEQRTETAEMARVNALSPADVCTEWKAHMERKDEDAAKRLLDRLSPSAIERTLAAYTEPGGLASHPEN